jgi:hypothetical protein
MRRRKSNARVHVSPRRSSPSGNTAPTRQSNAGARGAFAIGDSVAIVVGISIGGLFFGIGVFLFNHGMIAGKGPSAVGWFIGVPFTIAGAAVILVAINALRTEARKKRIRATGTAAAARLLGAKERMKVEGATAYELTLQIEIPGRDPYSVTIGEIVPAEQRSRLTEGATLDVRVDRNDAQLVVIVW